MRLFAMVAIVSCVAVVLPRQAHAHRLVEDDGSHINADTAIMLDDFGLSQVVYHKVTAQSNHLWVSFVASPGDSLYWQLGLPAIEGLEEYRPTVVVLGPGLPAVDLPFAAPEGLGGLILETTGESTELFNEHFTGTQDWIVREEDLVLAVGGRYYLVAYHPDGIPGKFWIAIGRREEFGFADILSYADVLAFVREYHEVEDERLPLLPAVLLTVSRIARFIRGLFSLLG